MPTSRLRGFDLVQPCSEKLYQPDEAADRCPLCRDEFSLLTRRHHCRWCGGLACAKCTESRHRLRGESSKKQRVCRKCASAAAAFETDLPSPPGSQPTTGPSTRTNTPRSDTGKPRRDKESERRSRPRNVLTADALLQVAAQGSKERSPLVTVQPALQKEAPAKDSKSAEVKEPEQPDEKPHLSATPSDNDAAESGNSTKSDSTEPCDACKLAREVRDGIAKDRDTFMVTCALALFLLVLGKLWVIAIWWAWGWLSLKHIQDQSVVHTLTTALRKKSLGPRWSERFLHGSVCLGLLVIASVIANVRDAKTAGVRGGAAALLLLPLGYYAGWFPTTIVATIAAFVAGGIHLREELLPLIPA